MAVVRDATRVAGGVDAKSGESPSRQTDSVESVFNVTNDLPSGRHFQGLHRRAVANSRRAGCEVHDRQMARFLDSRILGVFLLEEPHDDEPSVRGQMRIGGEEVFQPLPAAGRSHDRSSANDRSLSRAIEIDHTRARSTGPMTTWQCHTEFP